MRNILIFIFFCGLTACGTTNVGESAAEAPAETPGTSASRSSDLILPPGLPVGGAGACYYVNPFSNENACKQYTGSGWSSAAAAEDCGEVFAGAVGEYVDGGACEMWPNTGACIVEEGEPTEHFSLVNSSPGLCQTLINACENFARGLFVATPGQACEDPTEETTELGPDGGALQPEGLAAMESSADVTVTPECVDELCIKDMANAGQSIYFEPRDVTPTTGFIFYPGGNLDPRGYAVACHEIARRGYLSVLVPMPNDLALNGVDRAAGIIASRPDIERWVMGGHSLGGVTAVKFILENPGLVDGLALWATYLDNTDDLSNLHIKGLSVYGDLDPLAPVDKVINSAAKLPAATLFARIRGGNHSHFLWHGMKENDVDSELISQRQQSELAIGATLHLLRRVESSDDDYIHPIYAEAQALEETIGCAITQQLVGNYSEDNLPLDEIENINREAFRTFWSATKSFAHTTPGESPAVHVYQYIRQLPNEFDIHAPPIIDGERFCKLRSQQAISSELGLNAPIPNGASQECSSAIADAYAWALDHAPLDVAELAGAWKVTYKSDLNYATAPDFMVQEDSYVETREGDAPQTLVVRAKTFRAGMDEKEWAEAAGSTYCKTLSYQNAIWRIFARVNLGAEPWTP